MSSSSALVESAVTRRRKRQDIQLLRAIAVVAVVGYHFALPGFTFGFLGVDIFLVISGYLVGGALVSEFRAAGRIDVRRFFSHRIRRLLPASIVVIIATIILLYSTKLLTTRDLRHALWSSLYVQNFNLSFEGGDYLSKDMLPTYFVHFWSLSLEEQFYVFVPIILLLLGLVRLRKRPLIIFSAIGIASLTYSLYQTSIGDSSAYFSLTTRAWQFILGMMVANLNPSKTYARLLWLFTFLGLIAFTLLINLNSGILFPAPGAIIPSVITALALAAGKSIPLKIPVAGLQSSGVFVGDLSYSIYLVHFPISLLVAGWIANGGSPLLVAGGLALTFAIAFVLKTFVEDPVRFPGFYGKRFKFGVGKIVLTNLALSLSILLTIQSLTLATVNPNVSSNNKPTPTVQGTPTPTAENCFGANAMLKENCGAYVLSKPVLPPQSANEAISEAYSNGCHIVYSRHPRLKSCTYGATTNYKATIALVGDSHATQWLPAFDLAGKASGIRVKTFLMSECVFGSVLIVSFCKTFTPWVLSSLADPSNEISAVFISNRVSRPEIGTRSGFIKRTFTDTLNTLSLNKQKIFLIDDTPIGTLNHTDPNICLLSKAPADCFGITSDVLWTNPFADALKASGIGEFIPIDNLFCIGTKCYRCIGGVPVYRDDDHINVNYSKSTVDFWKTRFDDLLNATSAPKP